jgi:hypothetical protein
VTVNVATTTGGVLPTTLTAQAWNVNASSTTTQSFSTAAGTLTVSGSTGDLVFNVFADTEGDWRYTLYSSTGSYPGRAVWQFRVVDTVFV